MQKVSKGGGDVKSLQYPGRPKVDSILYFF